MNSIVFLYSVYIVEINICIFFSVLPSFLACGYYIYLSVQDFLIAIFYKVYNCSFLRCKNISTTFHIMPYFLSHTYCRCVLTYEDISTTAYSFLRFEAIFLEIRKLFSYFTFFMQEA